MTKKVWEKKKAHTLNKKIFSETQTDPCSKYEGQNVGKR